MDRTKAKYFSSRSLKEIKKSLLTRGRRDLSGVGFLSPLIIVALFLQEDLHRSF